MAVKRFLAAALIFTTTSVHAANSDVMNVCSQLISQMPSLVTYPPSSNSTQTAMANLTAAYTDAQSNYWDAANAEDIPACVFFPSTAQDVSVAMKLLQQSPTVAFALKSGGHQWNRGFSSTNGGVLISFRPNMNYTRIAADHNSAEVGPGSRWGEVMAVLDPYDRCVVGGRVADVGVGGYIPLGGISYLTAQYGFASDNVLNFEVVTANGTILNANKTSNPDIFFSIRGGGNLFGVVTKYTLQTHPVGKVWGGLKAYTSEHFTEVFSAITNYNTNFNETKSAIIPNLVYENLGEGLTVGFNVSLFWDGEQPPPHVFAEFDAIPAISDTTKTSRYPDLLGSLVPQQYTWRTSDTISSLPNMPYEQQMEYFQDIIERVSNATLMRAPGFLFLEIGFQPIPVALQKANMDRGPAALQTDPASGDKWWAEYGIGWSNPVGDETFPQGVLNLVNMGRDYQQVKYAGVVPTKYQSGDLKWAPYNPLLANDAAFGQPVLPSYGNETYDKMLRLHAELDPTDMFLLQTKGFQF